MFESETINRLADKLAGLELADDERAALDCILDRAADEDSEVAGFLFERQTETNPGAVTAESAAKVQQPDLSSGGIKIAGALGWRF